MKTVFIGGSRDISKLPAEVKERLDNIIASGHQVAVGDAAGADTAVQKHLHDANYRHVTVFYSGDRPRHNVGGWDEHAVIPESKTKDYQFHAAKDREMAHAADFGLMVWDGESPGTLLNLVRLALANKIAVLYHVPREEVLNFKVPDQLRAFLNDCPAGVRKDIQKRATPTEKAFLSGADTQPSLLSELPARDDQADHTATSLRSLNDALAVGNVERIIGVLGTLARERGMADISQDTGLSRESLYRSLGSGGNPEFATVMKVLSSMGIVLNAQTDDEGPRGR